MDFFCDNEPEKGVSKIVVHKKEHVVCNKTGCDRLIKQNSREPFCH